MRWLILSILPLLAAWGPLPVVIYPNSLGNTGGEFSCSDNFGVYIGGRCGNNNFISNHDRFGFNKHLPRVYKPHGFERPDESAHDQHLRTGVPNPEQMKNYGVNKHGRIGDTRRLIQYNNRSNMGFARPFGGSHGGSHR